MVRKERQPAGKLAQLSRMTDDYLHGLSAPVRDRLMQVYLAQARGAVRNGDLLRDLVDAALAMRAAQQEVNGCSIMDNALVETLCAATEALDGEGVVYAITGSIAAAVHGEPVVSLDVDIVLHASPAQAAAVAGRLSPRFYAPADVLRAAAENHSFTNVIDNKTSMKVDFSFVPSSGFLWETLGRRVERAIGSSAPSFRFVTPEDIILMKLVWRRDTQSAKQWENALSVARVKGARMDWKYLFEQAKVLNIVDDLAKLRDEAGI